MQTVHTYSESLKPDQGKWDSVVRMLAPPVTGKQILFDLIFGVVMPLICLSYDSYVFDSVPLLRKYESVFYFFIYMEIISLLICLISQRFPLIFCGIFLAGSAFAFALGLRILPYSIIGLFVIIGILGFTPFFTSIVYLRYAIRCFPLNPGKPLLRQIVSEKNLISLVAAILLVMISVTTGLYIQYHIPKAIQTIRTGNEMEFQRTVSLLRVYSLFNRLDPLAAAYRLENDPQIQQKIRDAYEQSTGSDIHNWRVSFKLD